MKKKRGEKEMPPGYPVGIWGHPWSAKQRRKIAGRKNRAGRLLKKLKKII